MGVKLYCEFRDSFIYLAVKRFLAFVWDILVADSLACLGSTIGGIVGLGAN